MRIVKPSAEVMGDCCNHLQIIEDIARTCYKSSNKDNSQKKTEEFVKGLITRQHTAMLEHYVIPIRVRKTLYDMILDKVGIEGLKYIHVTENVETGSNKTVIMTGSIRAWRELFSNYHSDYSFLLVYLNHIYPIVFEDLVKEIYEEVPTFEDALALDPADILSWEYLKGVLPYELYCYHRCYTVKFVCDRGVSHELVRHRPCSFAQESTRYCNYARDDFGKEISVISPFDSSSPEYKYWEDSCLLAEEDYFRLLEQGVTPQMARSVLPNSLKTEIIVTTNLKEWFHIFNLRVKGTTGAPHPQMKEVMSMAYTQICSLEGIPSV